MKLVFSSLSAALLFTLFACGSGADTSGSTGAAGHGNTGGHGGAGAGTSTGGNGGTGGHGGTGGVSGSCHGQADCGGAEFCAAFTLQPLCGGMVDTTFDQDCNVDADCADAGATQVCDAMLCIQPHGGAQQALHCRAGCSVAADCGPGFECAQHHCDPMLCSMDAECGPNFACLGGHCGAKPCTTDAGCQGFCVNSACSATIGACMPATP